MYRKLLIGYDASEQAEDAVALGRVLGNACGAELVLAGVAEHQAIIPPAGMGVGPPVSTASLAELHRDVERELAKPAERAGAEPLALIATSAVRGLEQAADETDADLLIVGSCRHGTMGRILVGSVGQRLLHSSARPVAVAPRGYAARPGERALDSIAVGFDGGEESELALGAALDLAKAAGASLQIVAVARHEPVVYGNGAGIGIAQDLERTVEERLARQVDGALERVAGEVSAHGRVARGDPAQVLGELDADLVVVGSRGYGPVRSVLLGGVALVMMRSAEVPVLVVPRGAEVPATHA